MIKSTTSLLTTTFLFSLVCLLSLSVVGITSAAGPEPETVEFFEAVERGDVELKVFARDAKQVNLHIHNKTDRPLALKLPGALAAGPILAQFQIPGANPNGLFNNNNNNNQAPQNVGIGLNRQGPAFNVPAGKVLKKKLPCVCLDYGKPDPRPRIAYEIKPLEDITTNAAVRTAVEQLDGSKSQQRIIQLIVWNIENEIPWKQLADQKLRLVNGQEYSLYSRSEIQQAMHYAKQLEDKKDSSSKVASARR